MGSRGSLTGRLLRHTFGAVFRRPLGRSTIGDEAQRQGRSAQNTVYEKTECPRGRRGRHGRAKACDEGCCRWRGSSVPAGLCLQRSVFRRTGDQRHRGVINFTADFGRQGLLSPKEQEGLTSGTLPHAVGLRLCSCRIFLSQAGQSVMEREARQEAGFRWQRLGAKVFIFAV